MDGRNLSPKIESPLKEVTFFWPWHTLCESPEIYQVKIGVQFFDMQC